MQLTRFDRWLLEEFVHETHLYTLRPPSAVPKTIREVPVPDTPGRRFQHHFIAKNTKAADAFIAGLREAGLMFSTHISESRAWYVPLIAPKGRSVTWRVAWIIVAVIGTLTATSGLRRLWSNPEFQKNLHESIEILKG